MTTIAEHLPPEWLTHVQSTMHRNGTIELCPDPECHDNDFCQANIHKVRLLDIQDGRWIIERPFSLDGRPAITRNMNLLGILGSGSHRWSFRTTVQAATKFQLNSSQRIASLQLAPPHEVKSAQRRAFFRISLLASDVPDFTCWPLLDLPSTTESEIANEHLHRHGNLPSSQLLSPNTDSPFSAIPNDLSGNGLSFIVDDATMARIETNPLLWIKLQLPDLPHPLMMVGRFIRHKLDPHGRHIVGVAFQFRHHRAHEPFIRDSICRWAAATQRRILQRSH